MGKTFHGINDFYFVSGKPKEGGAKPAEEDTPEKKDEGAEVRLSDGTFIAGSDGFQFNKKCKVRAKVEYLKPTSRKKVTFKLFCIYNNEEEDLGHQAEGFEKDGIAEAEVTLFYGDTYNQALQKDPAATCQYKFKASHSKGENEIESEPLDMPQSDTIKVDMVEIPDIHFHLDCALPCLDEKGNLIASLLSAFSFAKEHADRELVVEGHADQTGSNEYNFNISKRRAESIKALLANNAEQWKGVVESNQTDQKIDVEDYQQSMKSLATAFGWPCDPGAVDNDRGPQTEAATKRFQTEYNKRFSGNEQLTIDGKFGPNCWQAMFYILRDLLTKALKAAKLAPEPTLTYGYSEGNGIYPCGESAPKSKANKSEQDRRVELVFYVKGECSPVIAPAADRTIDAGKDPITEKDWEITPVSPNPLVIQKIEMVSVDDHFASGAEELDIKYSCAGLAEKTVKLEIQGTKYDHNPVFTRDLESKEKSDGEHTITWNGKCNCTDGALKDMYANPLYAPYTVKLIDADKNETTAETKVLYHSMKVNIGTYFADKTTPGKSEPDKSTELVKWVQYKLNTLGYFSGPVNGTKDAQTSRAIKRYTYATPSMAETDDETNATLQAHLTNNDNPRVIIEKNTLPKKDTKVKAYIDHNYFYESNAEWGAANGPGDKDADKLDRYEIPLEVDVLLIGKKDEDGTGKGMIAAGANGLEVEWFVYDPIEDVSNLPSIDPYNKHIPSRTKQYVEKALNNKGRTANTPENAQDNCPTGNHGVRGTNKDYFLIGTQYEPYTTRNDGDRVLSKIYSHNTDFCQKNGKSGIWCRFSYIAGDNYRLGAKLVWSGAPDETAIKTMHDDFIWGAQEEIENRFTWESGTIALWRRYRIASEINWPAASRTINWTDVKTMYSPASIELEGTAKQLNIDTLFNATDKQSYLTLVKTHLGAKFTVAQKAAIAFDKDGLYPFPTPAQGNASPSDYKITIRQQAKLMDDDDFEMDLANMVRNKVVETEKPGMNVLHFNWIRDVSVQHKILFITWKEIYSPGISCIGQRAGVAYINNDMLKTEQDGFIIAHELGHCQFLKHHETKSTGNSDTPAHHDTADHNCMMCYPFGIKSRPKLEWKPNGKDKPAYCGKCLLKLRGWKVHEADMPADSN